MPEYRMKEGSLHERFQKSRAKLQLMGGGFGNGKTAATIIKNLEIARAYPGANMLLGRSTYPRLNDTVRKEFLKWCPPSWIKSFPMSQNASNTCTLVNGTTLNFRYVQQGGKASGEGTTSNLLSATYDMASIDQLEDPEITEKDFNDILGRLRGNTPYDGDDRSMPRTGPRWFIATCNPTANWVYQKLVRPYKIYQERGLILPELLCRRHPDTMDPILDNDGKPTILMELFEGSTYENADNLGADFIEALEAQYRGQFKDRFLYGKWASYEGLVYPEFSELTHTLTRTEAVNYYEALRASSRKVEVLEAFDYGLAVPSCYLLAYVDPFHNVIVMDGFYEKEKTIDQLKGMIIEKRRVYDLDPDGPILADPSIFRRTGATQATVGESISYMFLKEPSPILMMKANNDIINGITKVSSYIAVQRNHRHPVSGNFPAPMMYIVNDMRFILDEIGSYYWQMNTQNERIDKPIDRNDHAMDALKYLMTYQPEVTALIQKQEDIIPPYMRWRDEEIFTNSKAHRYG